MCSVQVADRTAEWQIEAALALTEFDKRLATFDDARAAVEASIDEDKLFDDIEKSGTYRDLVCKQRARLVAATQAGADASSVGASSHTGTGAEVKLPKLPAHQSYLLTFDGNVERWLLFWESFEACVHKSDLPDVQKLAYLRSLLKGRGCVSRKCLPCPSVTNHLM